MLDGLAAFVYFQAMATKATNTTNALLTRAACCPWTALAVTVVRMILTGTN